MRRRAGATSSPRRRTRIPVPAFSTALAFFDQYRSAVLPQPAPSPTRLLRPHTYERVTNPRENSPHQLDGRGGTTSSSKLQRVLGSAGIRAGPHPLRLDRAEDPSEVSKCSGVACPVHFQTSPLALHPSHSSVAPSRPSHPSACPPLERTGHPTMRRARKCLRHVQKSLGDLRLLPSDLRLLPSLSLPLWRVPLLERTAYLSLLTGSNATPLRRNAVLLVVEG